MYRLYAVTAAPIDRTAEARRVAWGVRRRALDVALSGADALGSKPGSELRSSIEGLGRAQEAFEAGRPLLAGEVPERLTPQVRGALDSTGSGSDRLVPER